MKVGGQGRGEGGGTEEGRTEKREGRRIGVWREWEMEGGAVVLWCCDAVWAVSPRANKFARCMEYVTSF